MMRLGLEFRSGECCYGGIGGSPELNLWLLDQKSWSSCSLRGIDGARGATLALYHSEDVPSFADMADYGLFRRRMARRARAVATDIFCPTG